MHDMTWLVTHMSSMARSCYTGTSQMQVLVVSRVQQHAVAVHAVMTLQDLWAHRISLTLKYTKTGNLFHQNSQLVNESYAHLFCPPTNLFSDLFDLINTSRASSSNTNCTLDACVPKHAVQHIHRRLFGSILSNFNVKVETTNYTVVDTHVAWR